jgi:hypothetical protein
VNAPDVERASVALRAALDDVARASREVAGAAAAWANALALGGSGEAEQRACRAAQVRLLTAYAVVGDATTAHRTALAHARVAGEWTD